MTTLHQSDIKSLPLLNRGKVRDIYDVDKDHMLIVTTDRLSAFDVILPDPIPGKGEILTTVSNFWFARTGHIISNHLSDKSLDDVLSDEVERNMIEGRGIVREIVTQGPAVRISLEPDEAMTVLFGISLHNR